MTETRQADFNLDLAQWQPTDDLLKDQIILVTGAGDGIGRELSLHCARLGATVILLGKTVRKLEGVYDEIMEAGHPQPAIYPMDLSGAKPEDYIDLTDTLKREFGRLDALVHNAAVLGSLTPITHYQGELWYKVMQTNLHAPFLLTQACLELLNAAATASVIFVSDEVGRHSRAYWGAYAASKAGLEALMQTLAAELETNTRISVNSIDPGAVRTRMRNLAYPGENPQVLSRPADIVNGFLYLLGPEGREHTGKQFTCTRDRHLTAG